MATQSPGSAPAAELSFDDAVNMIDEEASTLDADDEQSEGSAPEDEEQTLDEDGNPINVEVEEEEEVDAAAAAAADIDPEAVVKLPDGKTAKMAELLEAFEGAPAVKAETTRILQEVASERGNLHVLGQNMAKALDNISNYLVDRLPPEPDPNLAYTNPAEHYQMTMMRQNAIAELQDMLSVADGSKQAVAMLSDADFQAVKREEDSKWVQAMPSLRDPKRFQAADSKAKAHALAQGFEQQEVDTTADHRLRKVFFQSARYEEIMANAGKAKGKVENASKMPPAKAKGQHTNSISALQQVNAKKRLAKSGSLRDAMKLNFS